MNWRSFPDLSPQGWQRELTKLGSPMAPFAADIARATSPHGCLALAFLVKESRADTLRNPALKASDHNPFNIATGWKDGAHTWASYSSYAACAADWKRKLTDPNGPYAPTVTLEDLVHVYAPGWDHNNEAEYVAQTKQRIAAYAAADEEAFVPEPILGNVPRPIITPDIVIKPEGMGWSNYGPRNILLGFYYHNVLGDARWTSGHFRNLNDPHGKNALTDWGVCNQNDGPNWDGHILMWNDPDSNKSPWASGDSRPDRGQDQADLNALLARLGLNLNQATEAIEISRRRTGDPVSAKCMKSLIHLTAYRTDRKAKVKYTTWPKNNYGTQMTMTHWESGKDECDARDVIPEIIAGVHDFLKLYQSQGEPVPPPRFVLPTGITESILLEQFPEADPKGTVTPLYLSLGRYPKRDRIETLPDGSRTFIFEDGTFIHAPKHGNPFIVGKP
ncbi:MAG: hypothetical protein M3Q71_15845 [Chloroflexota bacterium]|nr:hypothetical protein [Chloroflexota bacterium]